MKYGSLRSQRARFTDRATVRDLPSPACVLTHGILRPVATGYVVMAAMLTAMLTANVSAQAALSYYLPGTGQVVSRLDFENAALKTQAFNYGNGWAGTGFGLSGTQRGAPENVRVKDHVNESPAGGNQGLAFNSQVRDAAWYAANPSATGTTVYGGADAETQDDFFMYGSGWTPNQTPSVMMHVWLPSSASYTSLRMTANYTNPSGGLSESWPGVWIYRAYVIFRGPGRSDIFVPLQQLFGLDSQQQAEGRWWTLGLSVTPLGDLQYYATPEYVASLGIEHYLGSNSELATQARRPVRYVASNIDAIIMSSNDNEAANDQTFIDDMVYTKNALAVPEPGTLALHLMAIVCGARLRRNSH